MAHSVPIDTREITITPVFKYITVEDVPASERAGHYVPKTLEVVEVRFAGSKLYSPVFPTDAFWKRDGHRVVTYAERWADQYKQFLEGRPQEASGTPLEMLKAYGISDSQLSLCRALKVYSIESLHHLEGQNLKNLGMAGNDLKRMADAYMADRQKGGDLASKVAELEAQIAALKAEKPLPSNDPKPAEIEAAIAASDADFADMDDAALKAFIKNKTGQAPRGTPSHDWLVNTAKELAVA